jgi:hypothetical protein
MRSGRVGLEHEARDDGFIDWVPVVVPLFAVLVLAVIYLIGTL